MAEKLWEHDRSKALQLFLEAYEMVKPAPASATEDSPERRKERLMRERQHQWARRQVIAKLARRAPQEARRLAERETTNTTISATDRAETYIEAAEMLLESNPAEAGRTWRHFPLTLKNLDVDFLANLNRYLAADLDGALPRITTLKNEPLRGDSLVAAASTLLSKIERRPEPQPKTPQKPHPQKSPSASSPR